MAERETDWLNTAWQRTSRALRRVAGAGAPDPDAAARLTHLRQLYPAEVAALADLGLSDGAIAAYLLDPRDIAQPRRVAPPGAAPAVGSLVAQGRGRVLYGALGRVSAAGMRKHARRLMAEARRSGDGESHESLAEHAFELTVAAEELECRASEAAAPGLERAAAAEAPRDGLAADPCGPLRDRARRWRSRAEEYRTVAEALDTGAARDSYFHLARAYDMLAEQFESRARLASPSPS